MYSPAACVSAGTSPPQVRSDPSTPATELEDPFGSICLDNAQYVLVTGGLGFIGSHTSLELLKAGYNIIIVDNLSNSYEDVFDNIRKAAKMYCERLNIPCPTAELCCADYQDTDAMTTLLEAHAIRNPGSEERLSYITGVIHFAAYKEVADSIKHPLKYYQNNVKGLIDLVSMLGDHGIKSFIFSSTASIYGTLAESKPRLREEDCVHAPEAYLTPNGELFHAEQGCTGITNPYGRSKFFGEAILADLCKSDPSWTILCLRYFNPIGCDESGLIGENPRDSASNLFPAVLRVLTGERPELYLYGDDWDTPDGSAIRDFIHVSDLARGHIATLSAAQEGRISGSFRTFNLGTGSGHSVIEVVQTLESVTHLPIPVRTVGRRNGDVGSCVAVPSRAGSELGWKTEKSLRDACEDIWHYLNKTN
jgi:UDP-glucose 4-epimerase